MLAEQGQGAGKAGGYTQPATDTAIRVEGDPVDRFGERPHLAALQAGPAARAKVCIQHSDERTGHLL